MGREEIGRKKKDTTAAALSGGAVATWGARPVRPPKEPKRIYAFILAIFTVLALYGPFIDVY